MAGDCCYSRPEGKGLEIPNSPEDYKFRPDVSYVGVDRRVRPRAGEIRWAIESL